MGSSVTGASHSSQESDALSTSNGEYRYHEYRFGERDMNWAQWLAELEPEDTTVADLERFPETQSPHEQFGDMDWTFLGDVDTDPDDRSDASSVSAISVEDIAKQEGSEDTSSLTGTEATTTTNHRLGTPLREADIRDLKRFTLLTYPGECLVELPQVKQFLTSTTKETLLQILARLWDLDNATVMGYKTISNIFVQHDSMTKIQLITNAFAHPIEEDSEVDVYKVLSAMDIETLRGHAEDVFAVSDHYSIFDLMVPGGFDNETAMAELYGSAITMGGIDREGFGLDAEEWWDEMGEGLPLFE